jgi:hypothetical protein
MKWGSILAPNEKSSRPRLVQSDLGEARRRAKEVSRSALNGRAMKGGPSATAASTSALNDLLRAYDEAKGSGTSDSYRKVWESLRVAENDVRETIQAETAAQVTPIIQKLRSKTPTRLTGEELDLVRLWIIGDVEHYTLLENNYEDWTSELKRLMTEIKKVSSKPMGTKESFRAGALVRDATNVVRNVRDYLECKERLRRFEESAKNPTQESRLALAAIMENRLESDMF